MVVVCTLDLRLFFMMTKGCKEGSILSLLLGSSSNHSASQLVEEAL